MKKILMLCVTGWLLVLFSSAYAEPGFSEVNNELFDKAHLKNITQPGELTYQYKKRVLLKTHDKTL
ncbi:hypothetical protein GCM10025856_11990 [Methylophaga marina]|nr:hypothetical protein GCM10025856_11990 [Methylophaga marina]